MGNRDMLSVLVISHNQREVLRRCIESILCQQTNFPVQVIVSDDRSDDGTKEMLLGEYKDRVFACFCNSDEIDPVLTIERSSYNRLNGLKYATGKYIIHIDGDDFFTSSDLFQKMVDVLESHPDCVACCQNYCRMDNDHIDENHVPAINHPLFSEDRIVPVSEVIANTYYVPNSCFCLRRIKNYAEESLNGIPYDDNTITARYLYEGNIAILKRCDFVYVQYDHSSCSSLSEFEKSIVFQPGILMTVLSPSLAGAYMRKNIGAFSLLSHLALSGKKIPDRVVKYLSNRNIFLLRNLKNQIGVFKKIRYGIIYILCCFVIKFKWNRPDWYKLLYRLAIGPIPKDAKF